MEDLEAAGSCDLLDSFVTASAVKSDGAYVEGSP